MQQQLPKGPTSSLGAKTHCINFNMCPLCYGCRNYRSTDEDCKTCHDDNYKYNVCNIEKHKSELIGNFVTKNSIKADSTTKFKSY